MKHVTRSASFGVLLLAVLSCSLAGRFAKQQISKTLNTKRADSLWSDVPRMDGLDDSPSEDLPVAVQLALHAYVDLILNSDKSQKEQISSDWILFEYNGKATDLTNFYNPERMKTAGNWILPEDMKTPCMDAEDKGFPGSACVYRKVGNDSHEGLIILALQPKENEKTAFVYFLRARSTPKAGSENKAQ